MAAGVPTIWNDILNCLEKQPDRDISSLRVVACGGSAVPLSLMQAYQERDVFILQAWGMTETSPVATVSWPLPGVSDDQQWAMRVVAGAAGVRRRGPRRRRRG